MPKTGTPPENALCHRPAGGCLLARPAGTGADFAPPVVATELPPRVLNVAPAEQRESRLPADRVGGTVRDSWERVDKAPPPLGTGPLQDRPNGRGGQAPTLELREDHPADLVDRLPILLVVPDADGSRGLAGVPAGDDHRVPGLPVRDLAHDALQLLPEPLSGPRT